MGIASSNTSSLFLVANRLAELYGGKACVGLRIPDLDTGSRQNIDMVLVTDGGALVVSVKNLSGTVSISGDGSWVCEVVEGGKKERHPDLVEEVKRQALVLQSYLEQRGVAVPEGFLSYKIVIPNSQFRTLNSRCFPPEVITYDQWSQLKPEPINVFSGWLKGASRGGKKEMQESILEKLCSVLSTAPMWDRLELKEEYVLGEFIEFKGYQSDLLILKEIKRSKVSRIVILNTSMSGFVHSERQVLYSLRDYRSDAASSSSEWKAVTVRSSTEVVFRPQNSSNVREFKLSSIFSMSLST